MPTPEQPTINPRNNPESRQAEESASQTGTRSGLGGPVFSDPRDEDKNPDSGTEAGNPLDGVTIDPADAEEAVPGDEGPEHPGQR